MFATSWYAVPTLQQGSRLTRTIPQRQINRLTRRRPSSTSRCAPTGPDLPTTNRHPKTSAHRGVTRLAHYFASKKQIVCSSKRFVQTTGRVSRGVFLLLGAPGCHVKTCIKRIRWPAPRKTWNDQSTQRTALRGVRSITQPKAACGSATRSSPPVRGGVHRSHMPSTRKPKNPLKNTQRPDKALCFDFERQHTTRTPPRTLNMESVPGKSQRSHPRACAHELAVRTKTRRPRKLVRAMQTRGETRVGERQAWRE